MSKLRGAVVGVGYLGRFHAQKIKAHAAADLIGVCDYSQTQAESVAQELQTKAFAKPQDLLGQVDFVHIAASTQSHYDLARIFIEEKIPVLVEKPIAATLEQAEKLCELSEKRGSLLTAGHIERFNPAFQFLKKHITGVNYLELNRLAPFRVRGSDVSVLHDLTIHDIDLVNWLFRSPVKHYEAASRKMIRPTIDDVSLRLMLEDGTQVSINNSRLCPQIIRNFRSVGQNEVIFVNTATLEAEILRPESSDPYHSVEKVQLQKQDALALEVDHFIRAVKGEHPVAITAKEATDALRLVEEFVAKCEGQQL